MIDGLLPSLQDAEPDKALVEQVLSVQSEYWNFEKRLTNEENSVGRICRSIALTHQDKRIQMNLYNTALLSQRSEIQGRLRLPMKVIHDTIRIDKNISLSISVLHHSYMWLDSTISTELRAHVETNSDVALMGHQHFQHAYDKHNSPDQHVLLLREGGALQDHQYARASAFQLLLFDCEQNLFKAIQFKWANDMFCRVAPQEWSPFSPNRRTNSEFWPNDNFRSYLDDPGMLFVHRTDS